MYYNQNYNSYPQSYPNSIYGSSFNSPMQPQVRSEIAKVNGENGARAYQQIPNSSNNPLGMIQRFAEFDEIE